MYLSTMDYSETCVHSVSTMYMYFNLGIMQSLYTFRNAILPDPN